MRWWSITESHILQQTKFPNVTRFFPLLQVQDFYLWWASHLHTYLLVKFLYEWFRFFAQMQHRFHSITLHSKLGNLFIEKFTAQHVLTSLQTCSCGGTSCQVNGSCKQCTQPLEGQCYTGEEAYGAILGTVSKYTYLALHFT